MATIRAKHYGETEERLTKDPIVIEMANELPMEILKDFLHESGSPNSDLMMRANHEYRERGGEDGGHIGAIAHAILMIRGLE